MKQSSPSSARALPSPHQPPAWALAAGSLCSEMNIEAVIEIRSTKAVTYMALLSTSLGISGPLHFASWRGSLLLYQGLGVN